MGWRLTSAFSSSLMDSELGLLIRSHVRVHPFLMFSTFFSKISVRSELKKRHCGLAGPAERNGLLLY